MSSYADISLAIITDHIFPGPGYSASSYFLSSAKKGPQAALQNQTGGEGI